MATGQTAHRGSSSDLREYSCVSCSRLAGDGRDDAGASTRIEDELACAWVRRSPRYRMNSSSLRRGSRSYSERFATNASGKRPPFTWPGNASHPIRSEETVILPMSRNAGLCLSSRARGLQYYVEANRGPTADTSGKWSGECGPGPREGNHRALRLTLQASLPRRHRDEISSLPRNRKESNPSVTRHATSGSGDPYKKRGEIGSGTRRSRNRSCDKSTDDPNAGPAVLQCLNSHNGQLCQPGAALRAESDL